MSKNQLVTIGMATRNGADRMRTALDSLLSQTYENLELIISDNNSSDDTQVICENYAKKDKRIKYTRQKKNIGVIQNFNFVLKKASGDYFMWASDDDQWDSNFIKKLYSLLQQNNDAVLSMSNFDNVYKSKHYHHAASDLSNFKNKFKSLIHFLKTGELSYFYGLYKTSVLKRVGGYHVDSRPFFKSSDYLTIFKILLKGRMVFTNEVLFYKRDTGYHFARFDVLKNLEFSPRITKVIIRYLCFPLFYLYNLFYSLKHLLSSDFKSYEKGVVSLHIFFSYVKNNLNFLRNTLTGSFYLVIGAFKKIFL